MAKRLSEADQIRREAVIASCAIVYCQLLHANPHRRRKALARRVTRLGWGW